MSTTMNEFEAAKAIFDLLQNLDKERQMRVLRWVAESFDLPANFGRQAFERVQSEQTFERKPIEGTEGLSMPSTRATDIKSFVEEKSPKTDNQFAAVVAYFYQFVASSAEKKDSITSQILQDAARLAGRKRLKSPKDTLNNSKKQGYLDAAERGAYKINSVGENLVAMTLPGDGRSVRIRSRSKAKKTVAKKKRAK